MANTYSVSNIVIYSGNPRVNITDKFNISSPIYDQSTNTISLSLKSTFTPPENDIIATADITYSVNDQACGTSGFTFTITGSGGGGGGSIIVSETSLSWSYNEVIQKSFSIAKSGNNVEINPISLAGSQPSKFHIETGETSCIINPIGSNETNEDFSAIVVIPYSVDDVSQDPKIVSLTQYKNSVVPTDYVEIGGIKWATKNIGANSVTNYGLYFQWGDTQGYTSSQVGGEWDKKYFDWTDYKYCSNAGTSSSAMTKYNANDEKVLLDAEDDAATFMLGNEWRMPTSEEYEALKSATTTAWTDDYQGSNIKGVIYTDKTDSSKTLFFPASGEAYKGTVTLKGTTGYNWTCSLSKNTISRAKAHRFNSSTLDILVPERCVGCTIRPIKSSERPVPPPAEFKMSPLLMSTRMGQNIVSKFSNEYIGATGNALFLCKVKGVNVDDITITVSPQGSNFIINKISDWGFLMIKNGTWGYWPGGIGGSTWQEDITFSYDEKSYTAKFMGQLDEDNTEFLIGACTNKVFRIPSNGVSSFTTYCIYPYTFDSNYFGMTGFDLTYYDIENNVQGKPISSDNLSDTIFTSLSQQTDGLNVKLNYSVGTNTTNKYRFGAICAGETLVHFIQDPQSTTMIYFGRAPYDRYIKDDRIIPDENGEYLFHQLGSYNLGDSYNLSSTFGDTLLYPINLSDTYDITYKGGTPTELAGTYTWGEVTYKRFSCGSNITFKFIKK